MAGAYAKSYGDLVATVLMGAWRRSPPALEISTTDLVEVTPLLHRSGAAALAWWRVRHSELCSSTAAMQLHQIYRAYTINSALHKHEIAEVFALLRSAGVEAILIKGWAVARLYPDPGLRASGDIDLVVRPEQYAKAEAVLQSRVGIYKADLEHREITELDDRSFDELYARSQLIRLNEVDVRVLCPEDHLRVLCIHLLKHGAWRPLWLCDIAVALECRPTDFDWARCLGSNRRRANWVACAIGLAHQLLGVRIDDTPVAHRAKNLPHWLVPAVLRQWNWRLLSGQFFIPSLMSRLRNPVGLFKEIRARWDRPITSTIALHGPLNDLPRMPFQIAASFLLIPEIARQWVRSAKSPKGF